MTFKAVKLVQLLLGVYILIVTFTHVGQLGSVGGARDPTSGFIIDPSSEENTEAGVILSNGTLRAVVATTPFQMVLLGISRFSAFFMYPALILCFLTKLRATCAFLSSTMLNMFLYQDLHRLHVYCGWVILLDSCVHTICHLSRWLLQGNTSLLWTNTSGITGAIVISSTFLICCPMVVFKDRIKYEIRKVAHYLFLVFGIAMCFHAPTSSVPNGGFCGYVFPTLLIWYGLDSFYCCFFMTELIETTIYQTIPSGVQMTMAVSKRFQNCGASGGYAYVCFPWVDRSQWHAFSLFENPNNSEERQIFMQKTGDWTTRVHELLQRDSVRPVWIQGPFPSPYKNAIQYDNQILVAAGIGITPALSVMRAHRDYRRINLIWAVRDPAMLQFFLSHAYLDTRGWNLIFYTGKEPLSESLMTDLADSNVCIIQARPDIQSLIPNIVYGFESGEDQGGTKLPAKKAEAIELLRVRLSSLDVEKGGIAEKQKVTELEDYAQELGYKFCDLMSDLAVAVEDGNRVTRCGTLCTSMSSDLWGDEDERSLLSPNVQQQQDDYSASSNSCVDGDLEAGLLPLEDCEVPSTFPPVDSVRLDRLRNYVHINHQCSSHGDLFETLNSSLELSGTSENGPRNYRQPCKVLTNDKSKSFQPWEEEFPGATEYVKNLDPLSVKSTWGVLYCGGKNKLLEGLEKVSKDVGIKLHEESFNW